MPSNKDFIKQEMRYKRAMKEMVPQIYSAFAVSLHRRLNCEFEDILSVLSDTQQYWISASKGEIDILKMCAEETGINMLTENTANEYALNGDAII